MHNNQYPLMVFDTSALICYLAEPVGYTVKNGQCSKFPIRDLREKLADKRKILLKTSARQLTCILLGDSIRCKKKESHKTLVSPEDVVNIKDNLSLTLQKEFETWNKIGFHADELETIQKHQRWLACNPMKKESRNWLVKKRKRFNITVGNINNMSCDGRRRYLDKLYCSAAKGRDTKMLAQAYKIAREHDVFFISNDGDHTALDGFMRTVTKDRMRVMHLDTVVKNLNQL